MAKTRIETQKLPDTSGGGLLVRAVGDAGVAEVYEFERQLMELLESKPAVVVIDLSGLAFISSTAIGSLINFNKGMQRLGGKVKLAAAQPLVLEALTHARIEKVMSVHDSVGAATAN